jgi:uncharacterized membrane protein YkvA (DUF1232 family)
VRQEFSPKLLLFAPSWRLRRICAGFCAFARNSPRHIEVAPIGALGYFVLPFDFNSRYPARRRFER